MNLRPLRKRLDEISKKTNIRLDVIQQDYVLSWLLVGIFQHPQLKSTLVFKGGTALKKGYFGEYRYGYDEIIEQEVNVYCLEEIVLEKLRAILQHTKKLHERDWNRSRARDYYDLWRIFRSFEQNLSLDDFVPMLIKKCAFKCIDFIDFESFFDPVMINNVTKTWEKWLGPLVSQLPNCDEVLNELRLKIRLLLENRVNLAISQT